MILMSPEPEVAHAALVRAVRSGEIDEGRLNRSVERILRAKAALGLHRKAQVDFTQLTSAVAAPASLEAAQEMSDRGVVLLRDDAGLLPFDATKPQRGLLLVVSADPDTFPGRVLEEELRPRMDSLLTVRADRLYFKPEEAALPSATLYDWCLIAVVVRVADRKGNVSLPPAHVQLIEQALAAGKPAALVVLGSPYLAERFPQVKTILLTLSTSEISERSAVRALFGQAEIAGKLPVTITGVAALGAGLSRPAAPMELASSAPEHAQQFRPVFELMEKAVHDGVFPGGVVAVGHKGRLVALHAVGRMTYENDSHPVAVDTVYDLASLTKVVGTTTMAMMLHERVQLPLDAPVVRYLPEFASGPDKEAKALITIRHLLTHSSGLPSYVRFFQEARNREDLLKHIYQQPLEYPTGTRSLYSDLGIILLGEVLERASGQPLDAFLRENLFTPLGMTSTTYNPPKDWRERIAPTEDDLDFRHRLVRGEVHDENAWVMGGVAPHAGLFSDARDLAAFCQMLLNGGMYAHQRLLRRSTINLFTARQELGGSPAEPANSSRALGWDTVSQPSSSGHYFSPDAFGHTGFTGTSIWIDPEKELFVILLTNRVHPTRSNDKIRSFRPALHDAVVEALGLAPTGAKPVARTE